MSMMKIQQELKAPKGNYNDFAKYKYRSCEDIVEAVKPILAKYGYHLNLTDKVISVGNRVYVESTASVKDGDKIIESSTACAREAENKKGMDDSQITGTSSSYARKYALNGLFAIDDTKDADTNEYKQKIDSAPPEKTYPEWVLEYQKSIDAIRLGIANDDYSSAAENWFTLSEEVMVALWKSPKAGGCFSTKEREIMKSTAFRIAYYGEQTV